MDEPKLTREELEVLKAIARAAARDGERTAVGAASLNLFRVRVIALSPKLIAAAERELERGSVTVPVAGSPVAGEPVSRETRETAGGTPALPEPRAPASREELAKLKALYAKATRSEHELRACLDYAKTRDGLMPKLLASAERDLEAVAHMGEVVDWKGIQAALSEHDALCENNSQLLAENERLRAALEWYAAMHRPEDYLNDNGDRAIEALWPIRVNLCSSVVTTPQPQSL